MNISKNALLTKEGGEILRDMLKVNSVLKELDVSGSGGGLYDFQKDGPGFAVAIADGLSTNGALEKLLMGANGLCNKEAGEALANMLASNTTLKELDVSDNTYYECDSPGFAQELAIGVKNNGALEKLLMANNDMATKEAGEALRQALANNSVLKELDISSNGFYNSSSDKSDGPAFARGIADGVKNNGALTSLDVSNNKIGLLMTEDGWTSRDSDNNTPWVHPDGRTQREPPEGLKPLGAIALADGIKNNGALVKLLMGANGFKGIEAGKALGDAIAVNTMLKELDISGGRFADQKCDAPFIKGFSPGLGANGALVKFDISANTVCAEGGRLLAAALKDNQIMTELNIANNNLGKDSGAWNATTDMSGVIAISGAIPTMGAISNMNILSNNIGAEQANELIKIMESKDNLKTLCGFSRDETDLDLSGKGLSAGCAVLVANEVKNNGALTSLNMSDNQLGGYEDADGYWISDMTGIKALAAAIPKCK